MSFIVEISELLLRTLIEFGQQHPMQPTGSFYNRRYLPAYDPSEQEQLRVTVVPRSMTVTTASRTLEFWDVTCWIGVQQRIESEEDPLIDSLMVFVEDIMKHLKKRSLREDPSDKTSPIKANYMSIGIDPIYSIEEMNEQQHFTSIINVVYRATPGV